MPLSVPKNCVTPEKLVEWDRTHGQHLFDWHNDTAAADWWRHQAHVRHAPVICEVPEDRLSRSSTDKIAKQST